MDVSLVIEVSNKKHEKMREQGRGDQQNLCTVQFYYPFTVLCHYKAPEGEVTLRLEPELYQDGRGHASMTQDISKT
jgi:hypothetical protein